MQNKFLKRFLGITIIVLITLSSLPINVLAITSNVEPKLSFRAHVQTYGWLESTEGLIGTMNQSKRMESLSIDVKQIPAGVKLKYRAHVQRIGWQDWVDAAGTDEFAGTTGQSKRVEAIQLVLEGNTNYTIKYRAHVQTYGWLDWVIAGNSTKTATTAKGTYAGTSGESKRIEALEVVVISKAEAEKTTEQQNVREQAQSLEELKAKQEAAKAEQEAIEQSNKQAQTQEAQKPNQNVEQNNQTQPAESKKPVQSTEPKEQTQVEQQSKPQAQPQQTTPQVQQQQAKPQTQGGQNASSGQHVHSFTEWQRTLEPACNHTGLETRKCTSCGKTETKIINATYDHKLVRAPELDVPATCTERGAKYSKCSVCGDVFFSLVQPLGGHLWSKTYTTDKEVSCTENGLQSIHCTREGCLASKEQKIIKATGHNLVTAGTTTNCVSGTIETKQCTKCNYVQTNAVSGPGAHSYGAYTSNHDATCAKDGTETATCKVCGDKDTRTSVGSKLAHNFITLNDKKFATCEASGREASKKCTVCGKIEQGSVIPATGHNFKYKADTSACVGVCEEEECTRCGFTDTDTMTSLKFGKGHNWQKDDKGTYYCTNCPDSKPDENGKYKDVWWWAWANSRESAIWFTGFTCNMDHCVGYMDARNTGRVNKVLEGRRGTVSTITMTAPSAREGYTFDGWYDLSTDKKVSATNSSGDGSTYVNGTTIYVSWKDMCKGFEAKYVPSKK